MALSFFVQGITIFTTLNKHGTPIHILPVVFTATNNVESAVCAFLQSDFYQSEEFLIAEISNNLDK